MIHPASNATSNPTVTTKKIKAIPHNSILSLSLYSATASSTEQTSQRSSLAILHSLADRFDGLSDSAQWTGIGRWNGNGKQRDNEQHQKKAFHFKPQ